MNNTSQANYTPSSLLRRTLSKAYRRILPVELEEKRFIQITFCGSQSYHRHHSIKIVVSVQLLRTVQGIVCGLCSTCAMRWTIIHWMAACSLFDAIWRTEWSATYLNSFYHHQYNRWDNCNHMIPHYWYTVRHWGDTRLSHCQHTRQHLQRKKKSSRILNLWMNCCNVIE